MASEIVSAVMSATKRDPRVTPARDEVNYFHLVSRRLHMSFPFTSEHCSGCEGAARCPIPHVEGGGALSVLMLGSWSLTHFPNGL